MLINVLSQAPGVSMAKQTVIAIERGKHSVQ